MRIASGLAILFVAAQARANVTPGQVWVNLGPTDGSQSAVQSSDSGRVRKIVPHPTDPNILYVASAGGGVWKSFDAQTTVSATGGPHWLWITEALSTQSIGAFALDPTTPDNLYVGTGDPFGAPGGAVLTSFDGGVSWSAPVQLGSATSVREIVVDAYNTGVVLAATDAGLFRSVYSGIGGSWVQVQVGNSANCAQIWSVAYVGPNTWDLTCEGSNTGSVWHSIDGGASFVGAIIPSTEAPDVGRMTLAAAAGDAPSPSNARVYLVAANAANSDQKDVFISRDGGATFQSMDMLASSVCHPTCPAPSYFIVPDQADLDVLHGGALRDQALAVDPRNHDSVYIGGDKTLLASHDAGAHWYTTATRDPSGNNTSLPYVHGDWQTIAFSPTAAQTPIFYAATSGGIFSSTDVLSGIPTTNPGDACYHGQCIHFEYRLGRGLVTHLARGIAMDIHDGNNQIVLGGLEDDGARVRSSGANATVFTQVTAGDSAGAGIGLSQTNSSCKGQWGSLQLVSAPGILYRSLDCGVTFNVAVNGICSGTLAGPPTSCGVDAASNRFMTLASDQADASGLVFLTAINNSNCSGTSSSCTVQAGANSVYFSRDGAATWNKDNGNIHVGANVVAYFPDAVTFVGTNPQTAGRWLAVAGSYVYVTANSGADWYQSAQLGSPVTSAAYGSSDGSVVWATAGHRLYASVDAGAHWTDSTSNLPDTQMNVVAAAPLDPSTWYVGTAMGAFVTHNAQTGNSWAPLGTGLPAVSVTALAVTLDSGTIRVATYGRGFWELSGSTSAPSAVYGTGDLDHNQVIDGFDLVREAAAIGTNPGNSDYNADGNLTGSANLIDAADFSAVVGKLGGRP